ncbi:MAG TPA: hypothetical protein VG734_08350 [Lacunisphaera sp.]|nr:hypothetical protein [Lacunisphaera sp.]
MKSFAAFACLLAAASLAHGEAAPATKPTPAPAAPAGPTPAPPAATKTTKPAKPEAKKVEVLPKIPGTVITRENGNFLGLQVINGNFVLTFYDKKHKPMAADVTRVAARWPNTRTGTPSDYRTVLNGSGSAMTGARTVLPPFNFNVYLTLLKGEGDEAKAVENYTVQFRG